MSRHEKKYSEAHMLDAYYAGRKAMLNQVQNKVTVHTFDSWINKYNIQEKIPTYDE